MGATLDGKVLTKISGESVFVYISGGGSNVSGSAVTVSGNAVTVSGNALFVYISGGGSSVSGSAVTVSGNAVSVSGDAVSVSGNAVFVYISGGGSDVSGSAVTVSGNAVFVYISGGSIAATYSLAGHTVNVSGDAAIAISSVITTAGTCLEWVTLHMTSGAVTSAEFYTTIQQISSAAFKTKTMSVNPAATTTFDVFYQPDNPIILLSGAVVEVIYSNPDTRAYGCQVMFSD